MTPRDEIRASIADLFDTLRTAERAKRLAQEFDDEMKRVRGIIDETGMMPREIYVERIRRIFDEPSPWTTEEVKALSDGLDRQAGKPGIRTLAELGIPESGWEPAQVAIDPVMVRIDAGMTRAYEDTISDLEHELALQKRCASMAPDFPELFAEAEMEPEKREVDGWLESVPTGRTHCYVKVPRWFFRIVEKGVFYYLGWYRWRHPEEFETT